jgi:predicted molibdopterin-dependent oxidoreductase YjgC
MSDPAAAPPRDSFHSGVSANRFSEGVTRGRTLQVFLDGRPIEAYEGESVAAALLAAGVKAFRSSAKKQEPRGPYCGMGTCFECVLTIDGVPNVRSCRTTVRDGMQLKTQQGLGVWEPMRAAKP